MKKLKSKLPRTLLLNPEFNYVPHSHTDIRQTFARVRDEQAKASEQLASVTPIKERKQA